MRSPFIEVDPFHLFSILDTHALWSLLGFRLKGISVTLRALVTTTALECYNCPASPSRDNCNMHARSLSQIDIKHIDQVLSK